MAPAAAVVALPGVHAAHLALRHAHDRLARRQQPHHRRHMQQPRAHVARHQLLHTQPGRVRSGHTRLVRLGGHGEQRERVLGARLLLLQAQLVHADGEHCGGRVDAGRDRVRPLRGRHASNAHSLEQAAHRRLHYFHLACELDHLVAQLRLSPLHRAPLVRLCRGLLRRSRLAHRACRGRARLCACHSARQAHLLYDGECHHVLLAHARHGPHLLDHDMQAETGGDDRRGGLLRQANSIQEAQKGTHFSQINSLMNNQA